MYCEGHMQVTASTVGDLHSSAQCAQYKSHSADIHTRLAPRGNSYPLVNNVSRDDHYSHSRV